MEIKESSFKVIIKPNSKSSEIIGFDEDKDAYMIKIKARPENNKANIELIKVLKKHFKAREVKIKSGLASRKKIVEIN